MKKVTIEMISRAANVSVGTVDRALNDRGRISEKTKRRVMEIANEMGYRPNKIASALGRQRRYRIGVMTPRNPDFFYQYIRSGVVDAENELSDYGLSVEHVLCDSLEVEQQEEILKTLDYKRFDGLAINAGGDALSPYIDRIVDAGVPVVTFNSDAKDSKRIVFVGENSYKTGRMSGDMMGRLLGGRGKVGVFTSFFHQGAATNRRDGFCDAIAELYPNVDIVVFRTYCDDYDIAYDAMTEVFAQYPDLDGIFSNSAVGSLVSGDYVAGRSWARKPVVIGYDVSDRVEQYLQSGVCDMIIDQEPRRQSYLAVMLLFKHLAERWRPVNRELEIRAKIVMRYNAADHSMMHAMGDTLAL